MPEPVQPVVSQQQPAQSGQGWSVEPKDAYTAYISFAQLAEANSWNRFYNFLMFNTILILAWSTIFSQSGRPAYARVVLVLFCVVGGVSGVTWSALGYRGREYLTYFLSEAAKFEKDAPKFHQVCTNALSKRAQFPFQALGSFGHLVFWPLGFFCLYVVLLHVSLAR